MTEMSRLPNNSSLLVFWSVLVLYVLQLQVSANNFYTDVNLSWGGNRAKIAEGGSLLQLTLDRVSGSGFTSKREYLFGKIDMQIKVVPGNSAGTVCAYYLSSLGTFHDEIDFEFLGNSSGQPYTLHTNVYSQGKGSREQQFHLWFDPRLAFHTYTILWNPQQIVWYVDGTPIRVFRNQEARGIPYPKSQPMRLYASLWDAEDWATRGGLVKTDWSSAPFAASFRSFAADTTRGSWWTQSLDAAATAKMNWVRRNYMVYNYCTDYARYPNGFPPECSFN